MWFGVSDTQEGAALSVALCGDLLTLLTTVLQWTWKVDLVWCSGQTGSFSGKCLVCGEIYCLYWLL
jgi:hypothetical protein